MEYIRREIRELDEKRDRIMQQQDGMNIGTRERSTEDLLELRIDRVKRRRELTDAVLAVVLLGGIAGTGCLAAFSGQVIFSVLAGVATAAISVAALFFRIRLSRELNKSCLLYTSDQPVQAGKRPKGYRSCQAGKIQQLSKMSALSGK